MYQDLAIKPRPCGSSTRSKAAVDKRYGINERMSHSMQDP